MNTPQGTPEPLEKTVTLESQHSICDLIGDSTRREVIAFIHAICSEQTHVSIAEIREIVNSPGYDE